jgi:hypothetical protein
VPGGQTPGVCHVNNNVSVVVSKRPRLAPLRRKNATTANKKKGRLLRTVPSF